MKTTHELIRKMLGASMVLLLAGAPVLAQQPGNTQPKEVHKEALRIKLVRNVDGKTTTIDTTLEATSHEELQAILQKLHGGEAAPAPDGTSGKKIIMMTVDVNDSVTGDKKNCQHMSEAEINKLMEMHKAEGDDGKEAKGIIINKVVVDENGERSEKTEVKTLKDGKWVPCDDASGKEVKVMMQLDGQVMELVKVMIKDLDEKDRETLTNLLNANNGVLKKLDVQQISFYPNPSNGKFKLTFDTKSKSPVLVRIIDLTGKEIYVDQPERFTGHYEKDIDISRNPKGIYVLQVTQNSEQLTKKIVMD